MCPFPPYTGKEKHDIKLEEASSLTHSYQSSVPPGAIRGIYYGKDAVTDILNQAGCVGLRIYYGKKTNGDPTLVIVGVESNGDDLIRNKLAEYGIANAAPTPNPLNS